MIFIKGKGGKLYMRGRQLGLADQIPLFLLVFIYGYFFAIGFAVIASLLVSIFLFKGKLRLMAFSVVSLFWIVIYHKNIYIHKNERDVRSEIQKTAIKKLKKYLII